MFVSFFSLVAFTSRSSARAFSPTIIPSYTSTPGPTKSEPRSWRLSSAKAVVLPARSATRPPVGRIRSSPYHGSKRSKT